MLVDLATHGLFSHCLTPNSTIVDLGANQGDFVAAAAKRFKCRIVAVEPSPEVFVALCRRCPDAEMVCAAIGERDGVGNLHISSNSQASSIRPVDGYEYVESTSVEVMSLASLCDRLKLQTIDLLKIDIEGYEVELFAGINDDQLRRIGQISIELHDFNGMITHEQADQIERRLIDLGFRRIALSRSNRENVLFYQPSVCRVGPVRHFVARHFSRNLIGVCRVASRWKRKLLASRGRHA